MNLYFDLLSTLVALAGVSTISSSKPRFNDGHLRFMVLADWGGLSFHPFTSPVQKAVRDQMTSYARENKPEFLLVLGDNFYLYGVNNVDDRRFMTTFENVYTHPSLHVPWHIVAGNHDYFGNVSAQIAYSKVSDRWKFPDYYHKFTAPIAGGRTVEVVMIDTILLCGNVYTLRGQPVGPDDKAAAEAHFRWIEEALSQSKANYLLVGGHYPVYSVGMHGPTDCLRDRLEPMLISNNVTAYLAGHDHNLQHIKRTTNGTTLDYFIVGSGNFVDQNRFPYTDIPDDMVKFFFADLIQLGGFAHFEVTTDTMTIHFLDGAGVDIYQYTLYPRI
ncbi:tartrate-resistant acid phosphatase type 5-like [Mya arenaria]|nr:tartrate-resistant acid phosphatase type 5-like [Mya arenaria]